MKILCFGDSNTYGYDPRNYIGDRYDVQNRWPELIASQTGWDVTNAGLCGREIPRKYQALPAFSEYDCVILMLGTNDLLQGTSPRDAALSMEAFLNFLQSNSKHVLLAAPPPLQRGTWVPNQELVGSSEQLAQAYLLLAERLLIPFADTRTWEIPLTYDGVHFTEYGHRIFADQITKQLHDILEEMP